MMATSGKPPPSQPEPICLDLALAVCVSNGKPFDKSKLKDLCTELQSRLIDLKVHIKQNLKLDCINISQICFCNDKVLFTFCFTSVKELGDFKDLAEKSKDNKQNKLSKHLSKFAGKQGLHHRMCIGDRDRLVFRVQMTEKQYVKTYGSLCTDEEEEQDEDDYLQEVHEEEDTHVEMYEESKASGTEMKPVGAEAKNPIPQTTDQYCDNMKKDIILYAPKIRGYTVERVIIRSNSYAYIDGKEMSVIGDLWRKTIFIPVADLHGGYSFYFELELKGTTYGFFTKHDTMLGGLISLNDSSTQREVLEQLKVKGICMHLHDIFQASSSTDIKECAMQIETLSKFILTNIQAEIVVKDVMNYCSEYNINVEMLIAVALGVFWRYPVKLKPDTGLVQVLLKTLRTNCKLNDLPVSCASYIPRLCEHLCHCIYLDKTCLVVIMSATFPFLGESYFKERLCQIISRSNRLDVKVICDSSDCLQHSITVCTSLLQRTVEEQGSAKDLLERLLHHMPLETMLKLHTRWLKPTIKGEAFDSVLKMVIEMISGKVKVETQNAVKTFGGYMKFLETLKEEDVFDKVITFLADKLLTLLGATSVDAEKNSVKILKQLCTKNGFCKEETLQKQLFVRLASSSNTHLHSLFIDLAKDDTFCKHSRIIDDTTYYRWLEKAKDHSADRTYMQPKAALLPKLYSYLSEVWSLPMIDSQVNVKQKLESIMIKHLEGLNITEVLQQSDPIERKTSDQILARKLFSNHISILLKQKFASRPEDALTALCSPSGNLQISSWTKATITNHIVGLYNLGASEDVFHLFEKISKLPLFWEKVLSSYGAFRQEIETNDRVKTVKKCITTLVKHLEKQEVSCAFIVKISNSHSHSEIISLLSACGDDKYKVDKLWKSAASSIQEDKEKLKLVKAVMTVLKKKVCTVPDDFPSVENIISEMEEIVFSNWVTVAKLKKLENKWNAIADLPQFCKILDIHAQSQIFWNACQDILNLEDDHEVTHEIILPEDAGLDCIRYLFEVNPSDGVRDRGLLHPEATIKLMEMLAYRGPVLYRNVWSSLHNDKEMTMREVQRILVGVKIMDEMNIAKEIGIHIRSDVKETLERLFNIAMYEKTLDAMTEALKVFGLHLSDKNEFSDAVSSFKGVIHHACEDRRFSDIKVALKTLCDIANTLSPETVSVLKALGGSSSLISFLRDLVDEDFRNLIDAVEEVSEQQVQDSTVSGLIEVKRFLQPILKTDFKGEEKESMFLRLISHQTETFAVGIPQKVTDCMANLHNLKSLYNNVANRSEMTKTLVENVLKKGKFTFCIETGQCNYTVTYRYEKKAIRHSKATLVDMRSRALLLMNTDINRRDAERRADDLETFVQYIDTCTEIEKTVSELHQLGHLDYKAFNVALQPCKLQSMKQEVSRNLHKWIENLDECRQTHYLLNFIYGDQIQTLHDYFDTGKGKDAVSNMIKFINPLLGIHDLDVNQEIFAFETHKDFLDFAGKVLTDRCRKISMLKRKTGISIPFTSAMSSFVQNGRLFVAELQKNSSQVVNAVLSIYNRTVGYLPEANQILFCTKETNWTEINLLIERCTGSYQYFQDHKLYCIANVEILPSEIQFKLVSLLRKLTSYQHFHLAIICRGSDRHPFLNELSDFKTTVAYLADGIITKAFEDLCPDVVAVTSEVAGLGKTTYIQREGHRKKLSVSTLHISGPVHKKTLVERLQAMQMDENYVLHIDIGSVDNPTELDTILFELIILRFVFVGTSGFYLPTSHVFIEIANTISESLRNTLQTALSFKRKHIVWTDYADYTVSREINSPVQVVCHYLNGLESGSLDRKDITFTGTNAVKPLSSDKCKKLLKTFFPSSAETSYTLVNIFMNLLADQLKKLSCSSFFRTKTLAEMLGTKTLPTVKSTLVKGLLASSIDFAARSVKTTRSAQVSAVETKGSAGEHAAKHVESMIRWEESNHLMYVFHNQDIQTISAVYREMSKVPTHVKDLFEGQMGKKEGLQDYSRMNQDELQKRLQHVARTNPLSLKRERLVELAKGYALTPDNLLKMILIMLRVKAGIPVIVMGETGCGKTSLIRYLSQICEVRFQVLSIHAGVDESTILKTVEKTNSLAMSNFQSQVWLFLDEINTCDHLGLISDLLCHHVCLGNMLAPNLVVMAACNPYKLRTEESIFTSGLQDKIHTDELSRLVYRVFPLPESIVDFVWDFGSLNEKDEKAYIRRMSDDVFSTDDGNHCILSDLLVMSQKFVRLKEGTASCVSLRDVQRCCKLTKWFRSILKTKSLKKKSLLSLGDDQNVRAILLALAHCYQSRFCDNTTRKEYRQCIAEVFIVYGTSSFHKRCTEDGIKSIIHEEQNDILERMELPPGTAKNTALQENVFVILACILNKIPIFLVGKPGCSKSLSMQVIRSNLRGKDSKDEFFKTLPQLYCVAFQGSESSTSHGILKVFEKAENYQKSNSAEEVLAVVILDEIGLAEISRFNPLKVLHNLLEPADGADLNVAVVGISNWSLDASKMNRAIHLSRPEMDEDELCITGVSISESYAESVELSVQSSTFINSFAAQRTVRNKLTKEDIADIARSYFRYINLQQTFANFHGLRDFYSLVKFVAKQIIEEQEFIRHDQKRRIILRGLQRNFGGLPKEMPILLDTFKLDSESDLPVLALIEDNIKDNEARHLMLITTGDAVLGILEDKLTEMGREKTVIFGSHFEEDLHDDYSYRILSRIILCMERGIVLILKDLENIYGSLYDMLNQNYTLIGNKKNCRVALGQYSNPICHVHDQFKCIVLIQENNLPYADPPFLNRFEKQFLTFSDILTPEDLKLIDDLKDWISHLVRVDGKHFDENDVFPIYSKDMLPSLVMCLKKNKDLEGSSEYIIQECKNQLLWIIQPEAVVRLPVSSFSASKYAVEIEPLKEFYFTRPIHDGLINFLKATEGTYPLVIVFTYSNIHTKLDVTDLKLQLEQMGAFKSEKQFYLRMQQFWQESDAQYLILQCSAVDDERHILLAKSALEKLRAEHMKLENESEKHVVLVIHIERNKHGLATVPQINFLSDWKLVTLDCLKKTNSSLPEMCRANLRDAIEQRSPLNEDIREQLFWAITRIRYTRQGRNVEELGKVLKQMKESEKFLSIMDMHIHKLIEQESSIRILSDDAWQIRIACDVHALLTSSCFVSALEAYIVQLIKAPLAITIFGLETANALDTFFLFERDAAKLQKWTEMTEVAAKLQKWTEMTEDAAKLQKWTEMTEVAAKLQKWTEMTEDAAKLQKWTEMMEVAAKLQKWTEMTEDAAKLQKWTEMAEVAAKLQKWTKDAPKLQKWTEMTEDSSIFDTSEIAKPSGPECYVCPNAILQLRMPFSKIFFERVEDTKGQFMSTLHDLMVNCGVDQEIDLPNGARLDLISKHESIVSQAIGSLNKYTYDGWETDYFEDFCNFVSLAVTGSYSSVKRVEAMKWAMSKKMSVRGTEPLEVCLNVHTTYWMNASLFKAVLSLLESCGDLIEGDLETFLSKRVEKEYIIDDDPIRNASAEMVPPLEPLGNGLSMSGRGREELDLDSASLSFCDSQMEEENVGRDNDGISVEIGGQAEMNKDSKIIYDVRDETILQQCVETPHIKRISPNEIPETFFEVGMKHDILEGDNTGKELTENESVDDVKMTGDDPMETDEEENIMHETEPLVNDETDEESSFSDNGSDEEPFSMLVSSVCLTMLPTPKVVTTFGGIMKWHLKANQVLALASKVSMDSAHFHALRFCNDLALISSDMKRIEIIVSEMAYILKNGERLDAEKVFMCVTKLVELHGDAVPEAWRMYFKRCAGVDAESPVMKHLIDLVCQKKIGGNEVLILKDSVEDAFEQEKDNDDQIYFKIIEDVKFQKSLQGPLFTGIDNLFQCFTEGMEHTDHMVVLIVDILEKLFRDDLDEDEVFTSETNGPIKCLTGSECILREKDFLFRHAIAIAYCKAFFTCFACHWKNFAQNRTQHMVTYKTLNAVLDVRFDDANHCFLRDFFLKQITQENRISNIKKICEDFESHIVFLKHLQWTDGIEWKCMESSPLVVRVPDSKESVQDILGNATIDSQKQIIETIIQKAKDTSDGMMTLFAVAQCIFYLQKSVKKLDDTTNSISRLLLNEAHEKKLSQKCLKFLQCLLGVEKAQFGLQLLILNEETPQLNVNLAGFISSLVSIILSGSIPTDSVFGKFLFELDTEMDILFPFSQRKETDRTGLEYTAFRMQFSCCHTVAIVPEESDDECPTCSRHGTSQETYSLQVAPVHAAPVSDCMFELLKCASMVGSVALEFTSLDDICKHLNESLDKDNVNRILHTRVLHCWDQLKLCTGLGDIALGHYLHALLFQLRDLIAMNKLPIKTPGDRKQWEKEFTSQTESFTRECFHRVRENVDNHCKRLNIPRNSVEMKIFELEHEAELAEENVTRKEKLFRVTGQPSAEGFLSAMQSCDSILKYPFLYAVISEREQLELLKYAYPLLKWHLISVSSGNYLMSKEECAEMKVLQFIEKNTDEDKKKFISQCFSQFTEAWERLRTANTETKWFSNLYNEDLPILSPRSNLKACVIVERNSVVRLVLEELVKIQNSFIENSMAIAVQLNCRNVRFLLTQESYAAMPVLSISDAKQDSFIDFEWKDDDILQFSHPRLEFGFGKCIVYNMDQIEKEFAYDILLHKPCIHMDDSLPRLIFKDELYKNYVNIVNELKVKIPQIPLPNDVEEQLNKKRCTEPQQMLELLTQLDVVLTLLIKTGADKSDSLVDFIDKWKNFFSRKFPTDVLPIPENSVKLCHILSLHELLEEINADGIVQGLNDSYRVAIPVPLQQHLNDICAQSSRLTEYLLKAMKHFVHRCFSVADVQLKHTLHVYLQEDSFWPEDIVQEGIVTIGTLKRPVSEIVDDLLVEHTFEFVRFLQKTIKEQKQRELRMSSTYTAWQTRTPEQALKEKQRKRHAKKHKT